MDEQKKEQVRVGGTIPKSVQPMVEGSEISREKLEEIRKDPKLKITDQSDGSVKIQEELID